VLLKKPQICVCWSFSLKFHMWSVIDVLLSVHISWVRVELRFIVQGEFGIIVRALTL
jgi:hypothetical protein